MEGKRKRSIGAQKKEGERKKFLTDLEQIKTIFEKLCTFQRHGKSSVEHTFKATVIRTGWEWGRRETSFS